MGKETGIVWCHHTFNCWRGCSKVSEGCRSCYAETWSKRNPATLGEWGPNGTRVVAAESGWRQPLAWDREARAAGERRRVFCASLADVFEEWRGPMVNAKGEPLYRVDLSRWPGSGGGIAWEPNPTIKIGRDRRPLTMDDVRTRLFRLIHATPNLDWLLLTKRPESMAAWLDENVYGPAEHGDWTLSGVGGGPIPNLWLGVSVENQECADARIPALIGIPAVVRWLSVEPLLGPLDVSRYLGPIGWLVVGGESGHDARPMHPDWARTLRDQCVAAGVPYLFKQWGGWRLDGRPTDADEIVWIASANPAGRWVGPNGESTHKNWETVHMTKVGTKATGRLLDGREWNEFPTGEAATR